MGYSESLAHRIRHGLAGRKGFTEKKMFGGIGFLLRGNLCVGVWKEALIVRLEPEQGTAALLEPHVRAFDITGRSMKGWVMVEPDGVESDDQLSAWLQRAAEFVATLPAKKAAR